MPKSWVQLNVRSSIILDGKDILKESLVIVY